MNSSKFCKSTVSLILAVMMIFSMLTVGIVSSSAAQADAATTGTKTLYFTDTQGWTGYQNDPNAYYWGSNITLAWPGTAMTYLETNSYSQRVYTITVPDTATGLIFATKDGSSQTVDITTGIDSGYGWYPATKGSDNKWSVTRYQRVVPTEPPTQPPTAAPTEPPIVTSYKLSANGTEYALTDGAVSVDLEALTTYVLLVNKYENSTLDESYTANQNISADSFSNIAVATGTDTFQFTPTQTGTYTFNFSTANSTISAAYQESERLYFVDDTSGYWVQNDDANMFCKPSGSDTTYKMTQSVDKNTGLYTWYADVPYSKINGVGTVYFMRADFYSTADTVKNTDAATYYNLWTGSSRSTKTAYKATASGTGAWSTDTVSVPSGKTITDYSVDIWVDTKKEAKVTDAVKCYCPDKAASPKSYYLYLPSYATLDTLKTYTSYYSCTITGGVYTTGKSIYSGTSNTLKVTAGTQYTLSYKRTSTSITSTAYLYFMKTTDTASMLMTTNEELFTGKTSVLVDQTTKDKKIASVAAYKEGIVTGGKYFFYDEDGVLVNSDSKLKKIKGRGNSTFEASMRIYGKYAYNINLDKKAKLVDGSTSSKKWSLLANNADESMIRNTFIYNLADDIGLKYAPETRLIDLYDNGNYLGAYTISEKVEYGSNTLMNDCVNLDDLNEEFNLTDNEGAGFDFDTIVPVKTIPVYGEQKQTPTSTYTTVAGHSYEYSYVNEDAHGAVLDTPTDYQSANFLLEFELFDRYQFELSWFKSPTTGQAVVVKYPEYATQTEMQWIIEQFDAAETAIYADEFNTYSNLIDVDSFAKMYLIQELTQNLDSCASSYYVFNNLTTGKLEASPVWDYDWAAGSWSGTKYSTTGNVNCAVPGQLFVKNKSIKTDADDTKTQSTYCFEARLAQNSSFWNVCKDQWTNIFMPAIEKYIDLDTTTATGGEDSGKILTKYLPSFTSATLMNDSRWNGFANLKAAPAAADHWGSKVTTDYTKGSYSFNATSTASSGSSPVAYQNAVYYLNDWITKQYLYMSYNTDETAGGTEDILYDSTKLYNIEAVTFTYELADTALTVTPTVTTATYNGSDMASTDIMIDLYLDGDVASTFSLSDITDTITIEAGDSHDVYIKAYPAAFTDYQVKSSNTETLQIQQPGSKISLPVYFKSSSSYRYIPSVEVDGKTYEMTQSTFLNKNSSQTQSYYWYTANVSAVVGDSLKLVFKNSYNMTAAVTVASIAANTPYYFGADNMNTATAAVDLTSWNAAQRNFTKSATHMVYNSTSDGALAMTNVGGNSYIVGDADESANLNILDATKIQLALVGKTSLSSTTEDVSDFNIDGLLSISDATDVQRYLVNG